MVVICPQCKENEIVAKQGKYGQFYACSGYPKCKYIMPKQEYYASMRKVEPATATIVHTPSHYQQAIYDFVEKGTGNCFVEAVAGSGKSTSIVNALTLTPKDASVVFCAFNKHIADELARRCPPHVTVATIHSLGLRAYSNYLGAKPEIDDSKVYNILQELYPPDKGSEHGLGDLYSDAAKLVSLIKATLTDPRDSVSVIALLEEFNFELDENEAGKLAAIMPFVLDECKARTNVIDFDDMIWLPIELNIPMPKYEYIFIDECLPYHTPVLLADGTSMSIGDIVEGKIEATVLSYDTITKQQKPCRVTGWHKIANQKPLVKVQVRHTRRLGTHMKANFVVCTTDHKIYANGQWIEAGKLLPGMIAQVETSAFKTQKYKISGTGKNVLSKIMSKKNKILDRSNLNQGQILRRGGNGTGLTIPQATLLAALGAGWTAEYIVRTDMKRGSGYPYHYKLDIANEELGIAIEVDGNSHNLLKRRELDKKKDNLLNDLGWTVLRFSNSAIMKNIGACLEEIEKLSDCPVDAIVESIEPTSIDDYFVYDITVEECHNFYANGILVHNCQDLNSLQIEFIRRMYDDLTSRVTAVGDRRQSIYHFRAADPYAIDKLISTFNMTSLPLSICYRCPVTHINLAKTIVPQIEPRDNAPDGTIENVPSSVFYREVQDGDLVLCRVNQPLVEAAYVLLRQGTKVVIRGRDIGSGLLALIERLRASDISELLIKLNYYFLRESEKLVKQNKLGRAQALKDKVDTLRTMCDGVYTIGDLKANIRKIFDDTEKTGVILSTVHRAKGDEAKRVWVLHPELMPHPMAESASEMEQEHNLRYVAYTRSKDELYFVE